tara:strand:- start:36 stop:482 length:447 start_codon:yes stop_codon:yes gene_type:complete
MRDVNWYLEKYGESHTNSTNILIHKIFVPLIMFSVIGILWAIPTSETLPWYLNFGMLLVAAALAFYATMGLRILLPMIVIVSPMIYGNYILSSSPLFLRLNLAIFVISWIFQFVGHKIEGKKPSFIEDLLFLLVGPVWVFYPLIKKAA